MWKKWFSSRCNYDSSIYCYIWIKQATIIFCTCWLNDLYLMIDRIVFILMILHIKLTWSTPDSVRIGPFSFRSHSVISHLGPFPIRSVLIDSHFGPSPVWLCFIQSKKDDKYSLIFVLWSSSSVRSFHHFFYLSSLSFLFLYLLTRVKRTYTLCPLVMRSYTYFLRSIVLSLSSFFPLYYKIFCVHGIIISLFSVLSILDFLILYIVTHIAFEKWIRSQWNSQLLIEMHLYLIIEVINIQLNENAKIRKNASADKHRVQLRDHYVVITNQLFVNLVIILVHLLH